MPQDRHPAAGLHALLVLQRLRCLAVSQPLCSGSPSGGGDRRRNRPGRGLPIVWWFTAPGVLNAILLNLVVVCSVNTLVFNGNPLLRYDGYYVLSDLLGVPNLGQQSRALLGGGIRRWFLVGGAAEDRSLPKERRALLLLYAVASSCYRWAVMAAILSLFYRLAKMHGVEVVGGLAALAVVAGCSACRSPGGGDSSAIRAAGAAFVGAECAAAVVLLGLVAALLLVPVPYRIVAPAVASSPAMRGASSSHAGPARTVRGPRSRGGGRAGSGALWSIWICAARSSNSPVKLQSATPATGRPASAAGRGSGGGLRRFPPPRLIWKIWRIACGNGSRTKNGWCCGAPRREP